MTVSDDRVVTSGTVVAGGAYRLQMTVAADGFFLIDASERRVGYLSQDNGRCVLGGRELVLAVRRRRLAWELVLRRSESSHCIAVSRPKFRPSAYRINDGSGRRLRLSRRLRSGSWKLSSERGAIADVEMSELMLSTRTALMSWHDGLSAAEVTVHDGAGKLRDAGPLILLTIATIRAEMSLLILDTTPAG
jgi:hypothetical protein